MLNRRETIMATVLVVLLSSCIVMLGQIHKINEWERAHGYPYGRMCDSVFTGHVDTCRK